MAEIEEDNTSKPGSAAVNERGKSQIPGSTAPSTKKKKVPKDSNEGKPDETRQLLNLVICSIQIENLIPAHRFKKNTPWLNVLYGSQGNWTAPYEEADEGDRAEFLELNWNFILQRDTRHRDDLVIIVNSEDVIVGRYILGRGDWVNVPNTTSGYFKVSGDIINGLGKAGVVKIVFKKAVALPPKAPRLIENIGPDAALHSMLPHTARAYIRVISIACADLKSVNMIESNSPHVLLTCGEGWRKTTDVSVGSGLSAKWNRLPWKLIMGKFDPLVVNVMSTDALIGRIAFTLDEVFQLPVNNQGFIEIIRPISDGVRISGRVRLVMLVRPMNESDTVETFAVRSTQDKFKESQLGEGDDLTVDSDGFVRQELYPPYGKSMEGPDPVYNSKPASYAITGQAQGCPFIMIVKEIGVFDTKQTSLGQQNSLSCNAVCGKWGCSTTEIYNSGQNALWIDLQSKWKFTVETGSTLRFNVWSKNTFLGLCAFTAQELVDIPVDPDGSMEIMAKIMDGNKSNGRIKVQGTYEWYREHVVVADKIIAPVVYRPPDVRKLTTDIDGDGVPKYELPVLAIILAITAMDLKPVHGLLPNSPKAKLVCDRKMAQTKATQFGGRQGRWTDLNWPVPVNEGCIINVYIYSGDSCIGWLELPAHEIVRVPLDAYGLTVINLPIHDIDQLSTGRVQLQLQLNNVMVEDYDRLATKAVKNHYDLSPEKEKDINLRNPYVPEPDMQEYMENVNQAPFFSLEDARKRNQGIMLRVRVLSIDVTDLKPMHILEKNSPVVSAACGKFAATTKVQKLAGKDAFWDDLNWSFLMDDSISLQFIVGSLQKTVGVVNILPPTFIQGRADQKGIKRVTLPVLDSNKRMAGKIKITYTLGVVREEGYISRPTMDTRLVEEVTIPYNAKIGRVVASGLARAHTFGPNQPKFRVQADDWSKLSSVYIPKHDHSDSEGIQASDAIWPTIGWSVPILNDEIPIFFSVVSGKELIGSASINPLDLLDIPKTRDGVTEFIATLYNQAGKATGRLQVFLRCLAAGVGDAGNDIDFEDESLQEAMSKLNSTIQTSQGTDTDTLRTADTPFNQKTTAARLPSLKSSNPIDPASIFLPKEQRLTEQASSNPLSTKSAADKEAQSRVPLYFTVNIISVAVINLRSAHLLYKNSPYVHVNCEDNEFVSDTKKGAGKSATWDKLMWYFPVENSHTIHLKICSGDVHIGDIEWQAVDFYKSASGKSGAVKIFAEMKHSTRFDGKLKVTFVINGPKPPTPRPIVEVLNHEVESSAEEKVGQSAAAKVPSPRPEVDPLGATARDLQSSSYTGAADVHEFVVPYFDAGDDRNSMSMEQDLFNARGNQMYGGGENRGGAFGSHEFDNDDQLLLLDAGGSMYNE